MLIASIIRAIALTALQQQFIKVCIKKINNLATSTRKGVIFMNLNPEGCMRSMKYRLGIWKPSQHLLKDRGKPRMSSIN
jgi:hypothetical protein